MNQARTNVLGDDPPLVWSEEFSVGVPQLDADHRQLFELVGVLSEAPAPVPPTLVTGVLDALAHYVVGHFDREERHQAAIGFPDCEDHRVHHQYLLERLEAFRARHASDPRRFDIVELRVFLRRWLINHVLHEDMKYRWYEEGDYPED